jgi:SAM-dependent methyltransferase
MPFLAKRVFDYDPIEIPAEWGLRDIKSGMAYSLCSTLECVDCGVVFLDYRFSDQELNRLYNNYRDSVYNDLRTRYEPDYINTIPSYNSRHAYIEAVEEYISQYIPDRPVVLDWGGGSGINSPFRFKAQFLHVYDVSGVSVLAEAKSVTFDECLNTFYDLVVCSQVLEHVPYPLIVLENLKSMLKRNTILYLEVPLEGIFQESGQGRPRGSMKRHWHEHINFFSPESLIAMAHYCDLEILESRVMQVNLEYRKSCIQTLICRYSSA